MLLFLIKRRYRRWHLDDCRTAVGHWTVDLSLTVLPFLLLKLTISRWSSLSLFTFLLFTLSLLLFYPYSVCFLSYPWDTLWQASLFLSPHTFEPISYFLQLFFRICGILWLILFSVFTQVTSNQSFLDPLSKLSNWVFLFSSVFAFWPIICAISSIKTDVKNGTYMCNIPQVILHT